MAAAVPANTLAATLAALGAQLDLVFPPTMFQRRIVPAKLTASAWQKLTERTPLVGIGWDGLRQKDPPSRSFNGHSTWSLYLVTRNPAGPAERLLGDALAPGLFAMIQAATVVLNGNTLPGIGTTFVETIQHMVAEPWDMENLVLAVLSVTVDASLPSAGDIVADPRVGVLERLGITWDFGADVPLDDVIRLPDPVPPPPPPEWPNYSTRGVPPPLPPQPRQPQGAPMLGCIRWDAWYAPGSPLTAAVTASLSPPQFHERLPFFASVAGDGAVTIDPAAWPGTGAGAGAQAVMDAEIGYAVAAGIDFWAFLGHAPSAPESTALTLYLASARRGEVGFCLIQSLADLWWQGAELPSFADTVSKCGEPGYVRIGGRPLVFLLDSDGADIAVRYGGNAGLAAMLALLRGTVMQTVGAPPLFVLLCSDLRRGAGMLQDVPLFEATGAYAAVADLSWPEPPPYAWLRADLRNWWEWAATYAPVVPPLMSGWDPTPRTVTPNALFGSEGTDPPCPVQRATPAEVAAHVRDGLRWLAEGRGPNIGVALLYAWNEFDESNRVVCPTWLAGDPGGDTSVVAALGAVLMGV